MLGKLDFPGNNSNTRSGFFFLVTDCLSRIGIQHLLSFRCLGSGLLFALMVGCLVRYHTAIGYFAMGGLTTINHEGWEFAYGSVLGAAMAFCFYHSISIDKLRLGQPWRQIGFF